MQIALLSLVAVLILCIGAWLYFRAPKPVASPSDNGSRVYLDLRNRALTEPSPTFGVPEGMSKEDPWCVIMETGYPKGSATLVTISDGSASLYFSGGGYIGGGHHVSVRNAALEMVKLAATFTSHLTPTRSFPIPRSGQTIFYVRSGNQGLTATSAEADLGEGRHVLSPLFHAGHDVIGQYRLTCEQQPGDS